MLLPNSHRSYISKFEIRYPALCSFSVDISFAALYILVCTYLIVFRLAVTFGVLLCHCCFASRPSCTKLCSGKMPPKNKSTPLCRSSPSTPLECTITHILQYRPPTAFISKPNSSHTSQRIPFSPSPTRSSPQKTNASPCT